VLATLYLQKHFVVFISVRGCVKPHGHSAAERIRQIEKFSGLIVYYVFVIFTGLGWRNTVQPEYSQ
jgi:hypothetical protein